MGYRSQVAAIITFTKQEGLEDRAIEMFYMFLAEAKNSKLTQRCFSPDNWLSDRLKIDEKRLEISFVVEDVKWYDEFEDVKSFNNLIDLAEEYCETDETWYMAENEKFKDDAVRRYYETIGFSYVRIGEEDDDIDHKYGGDYNAASRCRPQTYIDYDFN